MSAISKRAKSLLQKPSVILEAAIKCYTDPYSPENTQGYLNFGVAENLLVDDIILEKTKLSHFNNPRYHHYHETFGCEELRVAFARFLQRNFFNTSFNPDNVIVSSGASAILEILSYTMCDEGDEIVLPAPYYSGFETDLELRFGAKILPFIQDVSQDFQLSATDLINFLKSSHPKAVLLCHPHNPTGKAYSKEYLQELITYYRDAKIHLIVDEVYSLTQLYNEKPATCLEFIKGNDYLHFIYSMAKDFSLGGFKMGYFYSENTELVKAFKGAAYFHTPSTHTQLLCANIFNDQDFIAWLMQENSKRLQNCFESIENGTLKKHCSHYTKPSHCFFSFINLTPVMQKLKIQDELQMFDYLMNEMKINMLPGQFFGYPPQNYFRLCYARPKDQIDEFVSRFNKI